jgi:hypothetical protein
LSGFSPATAAAKYVLGLLWEVVTVLPFPDPPAHPAANPVSKLNRANTPIASTLFIASILFVVLIVFPP